MAASGPPPAALATTRTRRLFAARQEAPQSTANAIPDLRGVSLMSFRAAATAALRDEEMRAGCPHLETNLGYAEQFASTFAGREAVLTADQIAAINLYTQEVGFFRILNARLRTSVVPFAFLPFIKLLLSALYALPMEHKPVFRGVRLDLSADFPQHKVVCWSTFTSTTGEVQVLQNDEYLGDTGARTMFYIISMSAVNIKPYSCFPDEIEHVLPPGCEFVVGSSGGTNPVMVHLTQRPYRRLELGLVSVE